MAPLAGFSSFSAFFDVQEFVLGEGGIAQLSPLKKDHGEASAGACLLWSDLGSPFSFFPFFFC